VSHLTQSPIQIKDIEALRVAAASFGATMEAAKTFASYERNQACEYAIKLPGVRYQVGVRKDASGHYTLHHDPFSADWGPRAEDKHDGGKLVEKFGSGLGKLSQAYSRAVVMKQASQKGWMVQTKTLPDGRIRMQLINT
jgi:hypothetical protein